MNLNSKVVLGALLLVSLPALCEAQGKAVLAREAAEYVMRKFGKEAVEVGATALSRRIEKLAVQHGDDVFLAVRKVGPSAVRIAEEAGEHGLTSIKLMAHYGDNAVWVVAKKNRMAIFVKYGDDAGRAMIKHGEIAEPLLSSYGKSAAGALNVLNSQNARRLAIMANNGQLAAMGRSQALFEVIANNGDRAAEFVWRNKGSLVVTTTLIAFLANPEPFLDGTKDITAIAAQNLVKPIAEVPREVAVEAARSINWTLLVFLLAGGAVVIWLVRAGAKGPMDQRSKQA